MEQHRVPSSPILTTAACLLLAFITYSFVAATFSTTARFWRRQTWVGDRKGLFSRLRTSIASITGSRAMLKGGYDRFSKHGQPFALQQFANPSVLLLPPAKISQLLQKSDDEIDLLKTLQETLAMRWTGDMDLAEDPIHIQVVRRQLTHKLPLLTADVHAELVLGFEDQWKTLAEWTTVPAAKSCANVISRAANRVFSGTELCRNQEFLDACRSFGEGVFMAAGVINMIPTWLRWAVSPLITSRNARNMAICKRIGVPVVEKRIEEYKSGAEPRNDALQWVIEESLKRADPKEHDPVRICRRIVRLNMVAIHTTTISITNTLLDLYGSPRAEEFVAGLREEVERVLKAHGNEWTKGAVNDLYRIDSTIKESLRWTPLSLVGLTRLVTSKDGIDLGDDLHVPHGVLVAAPNVAIHSDEKHYSNPAEYDAFRFARNREDQDGNVVKQKSQGIVTTNESFLTFGHGRHACPGRFFASQEMKLVLAHIVMFYDVRLPGGRPKNFDFKGASVPSRRAVLEVKIRAS
ncbi:cytochrome p450 like protein [Zymoseptoria brevis]|uniref:Cytochrome p450 like protein n=1 Tax=Zymoseptoria brevis TaxID=1047168 RepID=A0A0F4GJA6_9PEZI|nr:cytochrome p450 like protein [Zymoseptoria brevis]